MVTIRTLLVEILSFSRSKSSSVLWPGFSDSMFPERNKIYVRVAESGKLIDWEDRELYWVDVLKTR